MPGVNTSRSPARCSQANDAERTERGRALPAGARVRRGRGARDANRQPQGSARSRDREIRSMRRKFDAQIRVTRCGETVGGDSIMGILTLGAGLGSTITVSANGAQASEALNALDALVANRFGEDE